MNARIHPSFLVAVLVLVLAAGGVGYAAGKTTSAQIMDNTIRSRDVRNGALSGLDVRDRSLTGRDVRRGSLPRTSLDPGCGADEEAVFGGCVRRAPYGRSSHQAAVDDCNRRNGRLPTTLEITWIRTHDEYGWADGNPSNYEFTSDYTSVSPYTPIGFDRFGNPVSNSSAQLFWHHCVTS